MEYINLFLFLFLFVIVLSLFFPYNISYEFIRNTFLLTFLILFMFLLCKYISNTPYIICKYILLLYLYLLFKYSFIYSIFIIIGIYVYKLIHRKIFKIQSKIIFYTIIELIYLALWILLAFYILYFVKQLNGEIKPLYKFLLFFIFISLVICILILSPKLKLEKYENIIQAIGYIFLFIPILLLCCLLLIFLINTFIFDYFIYDDKMRDLIIQAKNVNF